MLSSNHCPSEKSPVLQSRMASPVTALHSFLHHSTHSVECDKYVCSKAGFPVKDCVSTTYSSLLNHELTVGVGHALFIFESLTPSTVSDIDGAQ